MELLYIYIYIITRIQLILVVADGTYVLYVEKPVWALGISTVGLRFRIDMSIWMTTIKSQSNTQAFRFEGLSTT